MIVQAGPFQIPFWLIFSAVALIYTFTVFRDLFAPESGRSILSELTAKQRWKVLEVHAAMLIVLGVLLEGLRTLAPSLPSWLTVTRKGPRVGGSAADALFLVVAILIEEIERHWLKRAARPGAPS